MDSVVPYAGHEPYIFLSYAHADAPAVMAIAARLEAAGLRVWYDGGIEVGSEWPEYIAAFSPTPMSAPTTAGGRCILPRPESSRP